MKYYLIIIFFVLFSLFPKIIFAMSTPDPLYPKVYSVKIFISSQVNPTYATPQNILSIINNKLAENGINKSFQGEVITFDQTTVTNCTRYPQIYAPDDFCNAFTGDNPIPSDLYIGIFHNYPGGGHSNRGIETEDTLSALGTYNVLFHELGHALTSGNHYEDIWTAQWTPICDCNYTSPFINDFLGSMFSRWFLEHSQNIINRNQNIIQGLPIEEVKSVVYTNLPDVIRLQLPDGTLGTGDLTVYYPDLTNSMGNGHTAMAFSQDKHFPTFYTNGTITYSDINDQYTSLSPFWSPYQNIKRVLFLGLLVLKTNSNTFYAWLDSSVIQMQFFERQIPTVTFTLLQTNPTNSPAPTGAVIKFGDANGDSKVDGIDYVIWLNHYNQTISQGPTAGDFNSDNKVDGIDYVIWVNNYNT